MPTRSPAFRRRTSHRRAANIPSLGIWITDAMLLQAIERYQRGFVAARRLINSHAGPLESRRRATKRHMTGVMPTSHVFPPIWQFDVGPDSVQWEPPTSQEHRRQKREQISVSGLFNNFIGWLENSGSADKASIPTLDQQVNTASIFAEALATNPTMESAAVAEPVLQEPAPSPYLPEEIIRLRTSITDLDIVDNDTLFRLTKICRRSLRQRVTRGDLSIKALLAALEPLDSTSKSRVPTVETANKICAMIRRSILYAMVDVQKQTPGAVSPELWLAFMGRVCAGNGNNHDIQLFWRLMDTLPGSLRRQISMEQILNLSSSFVTAQASRHNIFAHWSARAARFSQALEALDAQQRQELDDRMATYLLQQDWVSEKARRMRFSWLVIRAYDPCATTNHFIQTIRAGAGKDFKLHGMHLWQVMAARLSAIEALNNEARKKVMEATYNSMSQRWASLLAAVMSSGSNDGLREICTILTQIGQFDAIVRALTCWPISLLQRDITEALASACDSHQQALLLYDSIDMKRSLGRKRPLWHWSVWTKYVEQMINDPALDPLRVWQVLGLTNEQSRANDTPEDVDAKMQLLDRMGQWFVKAKHLNDRQVLRNVERCASYQRVLSNGVSSQTLANMTDIITRDLENGQRGRTSRMQWLLDMVAQNHGQEQARSTASALNGWRFQIDRKHSQKL